MDLRDYLSPINPLSRLSHPIHLRCIGSYLSLLIPLYLFFLSTHPLLTLSFPLPEIVDLGGFIFCLIFSLYSLYLYSSLYHPYIVRVLISSHPISKIGWVFITLPLYITLSFCFLLLLYLLFNLISLLYLLYYYIFSFTRRVWNTYGVCLHLIYSIIYFYCFPTFTFFSLLYLYYITLFSISIFSFTRRVLHLRGCIFLSLSISSHCLPYSFYTIPDLSVLPLWHTFLLYYP